MNWTSRVYHTSTFLIYPCINICIRKYISIYLDRYIYIVTRLFVTRLLFNNVQGPQGLEKNFRADKIVHRI